MKERIEKDRKSKGSNKDRNKTQILTHPLFPEGITTMTFNTSVVLASTCAEDGSMHRCLRV